jgi:flagellar biosynthesis protein FlhB
MIALSPFWQLVALLATHWFGDFVLQTNYQAAKKSKRLDALSLHVATYMATLFVAAVILFGLTLATLAFTTLNGGLHFATDYFTSRELSKLRAKQDWHLFFVVIGFDQLIHQVTLATTLWVLLRGGSW